MYMSVLPVYLCIMCVPGAHGNLKVTNLIELQMVASHMWVLGNKPRTFAKAANHRTI